jgi:type VI secretion system protein VasI
MRRGILLAIVSFPSVQFGLGAQESRQHEGTGKWNLSEEIDPLYGTPTVIIALDSEKGTSTRGKPIKLIIRCKDGRTEAYTRWTEYLGREAFLTTRLGTGEVTNYHWNISTDNQAAFYPGNPKNFIEQLRRVDTFIAEVRPYDKDPITAVFFLKGLESALAPIQAACPR